MELRKRKIMVNKAGGNAGKGSLNYRVSLPAPWVKDLDLDKKDSILYFNGDEIVITELGKIVDKLKNQILKISYYFDWIVIEDSQTKKHSVYGTNVEYENIIIGGGKAGVIDTDEIIQDNIILRNYYAFNPTEEEYYINTEELTKLILDYWS